MDQRDHLIPGSLFEKEKGWGGREREREKDGERKREREAHLKSHKILRL